MGINIAKAVNKNKPKKFNIFDIVNVIFQGILGLTMVFPFYYVFIISFAKYESIAETPVYLLPKSIDLQAYSFIFKNNYITSSLFVSIFVTVVGTLFSMICSVGLAYALSKPRMPGRKFFFIFMLVTMFFDGGLIPYYMTVQAVGLVNNIFVLIIPMLVNAFNVILLKNYFETVPASLEESAKIDGANDMYILWKIVLPTSAPIIATISLFYAVDRWNEWWHAMLFISSKKLYPLQMVLREILFNFDNSMGSAMGRSIIKSKRLIYGRSVQMAVVLVATIPIFIVYPYLQKYFTRGIMLGSIKE